MATKLPPKLTLKQFMVRRQVLSLYRNILRACREVPGEKNKTELRDWVRSDFRKNMNVTDENAVTVLLQHGKSFLEELRKSISMSR